MGRVDIGLCLSYPELKCQVCLKSFWWSTPPQRFPWGLLSTYYVLDALGAITFNPEPCEGGVLLSQVGIQVSKWRCYSPRLFAGKWLMRILRFRCIRCSILVCRNIVYFMGVQFSSVTQLSLTLGDPMDCSTPGFPVHHQLPERAQTHVHWVSDTIQPSHPLMSPSLPALNRSQHQGLFQGVSSSHQVTRVLEFQHQTRAYPELPSGPHSVPRGWTGGGGHPGVYVLRHPITGSLQNRPFSHWGLYCWVPMFNAPHGGENMKPLKLKWLQPGCGKCLLHSIQWEKQDTKRSA